MALRARTNQEGAIDFSARVPGTRGEMLAAAAQLRSEHAVLARLSPKAVRAEARVYWAAGWTNTDVLHALTYRPAATAALPAMRAEAIWHPARWIAARLAAWRGPRGRILPGLSQQQHTRTAVRERHGHGALAALPSCARVLTSGDVREHARQQRPAAAEAIARNHRRTTAETHRRPRTTSEAATTEQRQAAHQHWHTNQAPTQSAEQAAPAEQPPSLRQRLVAAAYAANGDHAKTHDAAADAPPHTSPLTPTRSEAGSAYERARAKARTERGRRQVLPVRRKRR